MDEIFITKKILTDFFNADGIEAVFEKTAKKSRRYDTSIADIDEFKNVLMKNNKNIVYVYAENYDRNHLISDELVDRVLDDIVEEAIIDEVAEGVKKQVHEYNKNLCKMFRKVSAYADRCSHLYSFENSFIPHEPEMFVRYLALTEKCKILEEGFKS